MVQKEKMNKIELYQNSTKRLQKRRFNFQALG